jgi:hypothetical protein
MIYKGEKVKSWMCDLKDGHEGPHECHADETITLGGGAYLKYEGRA